MGVDVLTQLAVDSEGLLGAIVQQADPFPHRFLGIGSLQEVAGLQNDLERIAQVVHQPAHFCRLFRRDDTGFGRRIIGHRFTFAGSAYVTPSPLTDHTSAQWGRKPVSEPAGKPRLEARKPDPDGRRHRKRRTERRRYK